MPGTSAQEVPIENGGKKRWQTFQECIGVDVMDCIKNDLHLVDSTTLVYALISLCTVRGAPSQQKTFFKIGSSRRIIAALPEKQKAKPRELRELFSRIEITTLLELQSEHSCASYLCWRKINAIAARRLAPNLFASRTMAQRVAVPRRPPLLLHRRFVAIAARHGRLLAAWLRAKRAAQLAAAVHARLPAPLAAAPAAPTPLPRQRQNFIETVFNQFNIFAVN
ncbi:hypothetical protein NPIL_504601 [Nephila pilipes]|uniref:Uncharacterized protein n=1 Tax=Nephila pilipes TaxID=299642 RepID=A0A8X6NVU0_NEPPI|nr:hypothetical protein NPIL_504601 [Nephila pilipes]